VSTAELGFAPEIESLVAIGEMSGESADLNRRLAIVVGDFIVNHLAHDPLFQAMFRANDREHFIEGVLAQRAYLEGRWIAFLADHITR
jgi:hypothetical protein